MSKRTRNNFFQPDDYNEPTEPLRIDEPPFGMASPVDRTLPMIASGPAIQAGLPAFPLEPGRTESGQSAEPTIYPVLPPAPFKEYEGTPPGGAASAPARRRRRSLLPGLVKIFFLLVQLVLLVRVVCLLFAVQNTMLWLTLLFAVSDLFLWPVRSLAAGITVPVLAGTPLLGYLEYLVAILAYGLLARFLAFLFRRVRG